MKAAMSALSTGVHVIDAPYARWVGRRPRRRTVTMSGGWDRTLPGGGNASIQLMDGTSNGEVTPGPWSLTANAAAASHPSKGC